jgi:glycosyltransferase involved in cell wall biosynthesis
MSQPGTRNGQLCTIVPGELGSHNGAAAGSRLSVLHVLAPGAYGGLEQVVHSLTTGHADLGHSIQVVALLSSPAQENPFVVQLAGTRVRVQGNVHPSRHYLAQTRTLHHILRRERPAIVHTHGYHADLLAGRVAHAHGIPTITTLHGFTGGDWKNRCYEWLQRRALRRYDRVVAVSQSMLSALQKSGIPQQCISVIPNAWRPNGQPLRRSVVRSSLGIEPQSFHLGWVGRASPEKGLDVLINALAYLRDLPIVVSVIGDGAERARAEKLAAQLGVQDRVRWQGVKRDAWRLFPGFDLFVLSSRTEGTPIVLFEAMFAGVPIVTTAVGGVPNVVSAREALLVAPDAPRLLADAIRRTFEDPSSARTRARAARSRLSDFSVPVWLERYLNLYHSLVRQGSDS